jgi:hypothetical protein
VALLSSAQDFTAQQTFSAGMDIDNDQFIGWGGGSSRPAITGNKTSNKMEFYVGGAERLDLTSTDLVSSLTGSFKVPVGTTAQRTSSAANGMFRYNSDDNAFEGYAGGAWSAIGGGGSADFQEFTSSGTYTKPSGVNYIFVEAIGGGGSGGKGSFDGDGAQGGGGGAYVSQLFRASDVGSTETVTIGAGGASLTSSGTGNDGGTTTFGSLLTALGGEGGLKNNTAGRGAPYDRSNSSSVDNNVVVSYAGKGGLANGFGGKTIYGGGGGGGAKTANRDGGTSVFGGDGGEGFSDGTNGAAGTAPGGGGGAADTGNSGAGAAGRIRVSAW